MIFCRHVLLVRLRKDMITYSYWFITPQRMAIGAYSPYGFLNAILFATVIPPDARDLHGLS